MSRWIDWLRRPTAGPPPLRMRRSRAPRILLLEPERDLARHLAAILRGEGYEVEVAMGGIFLEDRVCDRVVDPVACPDLVIANVSVDPRTLRESVARALR